MEFTMMERAMIWRNGHKGLYKFETEMFERAGEAYTRGCLAGFEVCYGLFLKLRSITCPQIYTEMYQKIRKEDNMVMAPICEMLEEMEKDTDDNEEEDDDTDAEIEGFIDLAADIMAMADALNAVAQAESGRQK